MTSIAHITGQRVSGILTNSRDTVVATQTAVRSLIMSER